MAKATPAKSVDEYLQAQPEPVREGLEKIRQAIKSAAPKAEEVISYQVPTYKYKGPVVHFAAFKDHCSLIVVTESILDRFEKELRPFKTSGRTIHFTLDKPLPATLVRKIVKARLQENEERESTTKPREGKTKAKSPAKENGTEEVKTFMDNLEHRHKAEVEKVRAIILKADKKITERIKWNAPSFCYGGDDRVTFNLKAKSGIQLIFHRGAKAKKSDGFRFEDATGLLDWIANDRASVTFADMDEVKAKEKSLVKVVREWIERAE